MDDAERLEQLQLLIDSAAGIAPRRGDLRRVRSQEFQKPGFDPALWRDIAAMGWLGLRRPEPEGGAGMGLLEYAALATEAGAALLPEPLVEAELAIDLMGADTPKEVLDGSLIALPAWAHDADGLNPTGGITVSGDRLSGEKRFVPMAAAADLFVVTTAEGSFMVDRGDVDLTTEATQDGGHLGRLRMTGAAGRRVSGMDAAAALDMASLGNAARLLGVMERAFALTLDYLRTRVLFGRPIGSFQALQHRAVDLKVQIAITRAVLRDACLAAETNPQAARPAVSRAAARASDAAMLVTRQAIQLHGAIGYTDEADIALFLRKALVLVNRYGSPGWHRARHAALGTDLAA